APRRPALQRFDASESCVKIESFPVVEQDHEPGPVGLLDRSGPPGFLSHPLAGHPLWRRLWLGRFARADEPMDRLARDAGCLGDLGDVQIAIVDVAEDLV